MIWLVVLAAVVMLILAAAMTYVLGWANKAFHVEVDPKVEAINKALPGANCGGCGYLGCSDYAEAIVTVGAAPNLCPVGGPALAETIAQIAGVELADAATQRPVVHCLARCGQKPGANEYRGEKTCASANLVPGVQGCVYGCLSLGDCVEACRFDAIDIVDGMVTIDYDKCVGCGACVAACPRNIISMIPFKDDEMYVLACRNTEKGADVKNVCALGCRGCTICARLSGGLVQMDGNIARIDYDAYDPATVDEKLLPVLEKCPSKQLFRKVGKEPTADRQAKTPAHRAPSPPAGVEASS